MYMTTSTTKLTASIGLLLGLLGWALSNSLRLSWSQDWVLISSVAAPAVWTAFGAGALLGLSGSLRPRGDDTIASELGLLAAVAGALAGITFLSALGPLSTACGGIAGAVLAYSLALPIARGGRAWLPLQALLLVLCSAMLLSANVYERAELGALQVAYAWLLGDVSRASAVAAVLLCAAALALGAAALRILRDTESSAMQHARLRPLAWASCGLALGAAGPIAFVAALTPALARGLMPAASPRVQALGAMSLGAATLVALEAGLRTTLGGFALPLGAVLALLGGPLCLALRAARLRRDGAPAPMRGYRVIEYALVLVVGLLSAFVLVSTIRVIRAFLA